MSFIYNIQNIPDIVAVALTLFAEGAGEPYAGKILIGESIVNRAIIKRKTLKEICLEKKNKAKYYQYSCWNDKESTFKKLNSKNFDTIAWRECMMIARTISTSNYIPSSRVTHYLNPKRVKRLPKWSKEFNMVAVVGNHEFYSEISLMDWYNICGKYKQKIDSIKK